MSLFTKSFWLKAIENAIVTGAAAFAASGVFTGGIPSTHSWIVAGVAAGIAALYSLVKQIGGVQSVNAAESTKPATRIT